MTEPQPSISLCMLVYNEAATLGRCLSSAKGLYDELIIVDTGSTDESVAVASSYDAIITKAAWQDDFSLARNLGLDLATKDWIFILDPDETISPRDIPLIRALTLNPAVDAYQFPTRNYTNSSFLIAFKPNPLDYEEGKGFRGFAESVKTRLFRNHIGLKFEGAIHELIDHMVTRRGLHGVKSSIPIHHDSGGSISPAATGKPYFYLRVCEKKAELSPNDGKAIWELAIAQYCIGARAVSLKNMLRAVTLDGSDAERLFLIGILTQELGDKERGQRYFEKATCLNFPELTHIREEFKKFPEEERKGPPPKKEED